jgi:YNFM family putative membrane transporter
MLLSGTALMLAGVLVTLSSNIVVVVIGLSLMTIGFFGGHAIASGWVSRRAIFARAQAASLYLFCYYFGSSLIGSFGGTFWSKAGWPGIVGLVSGLLGIAIAIGFFLRRMELAEHPAPD